MRAVMRVVVGAAWLAGAFALGFVTAPVEEAEAPRMLVEAPRHEPVVAPAPAAVGATPDAADPRWAELEAELERTRALEREQFGEPAPWGDDRARAEAEAVMREQLGGAADCAGPGWTIADVDCAEDPCVGMMWGPPGGLGGRTWSNCVRDQGLSSTSASTVACAGGRRVLATVRPSGQSRRAEVRAQDLRDRTMAGCGAPRRR